MSSPRRTFDTGKLAEAIKTKGIDPRHWVSHGTVGVVGDDGTEDYSDPHAVIVAPDGVWCDVLLQPLNIPVTARVQLGVGGRSCSIQAPIRPGDEVLVLLPDGEFSNPPTIVAVLNNQGHKLPIDQADRKPVFRNDRLSIFANDVPVEVRTASGAVLRLETDGEISMTPAASKKVKVGGLTGLHPAALGDVVQDFIDTLTERYNAHTHAGVTVGAGVTAVPATLLGPAPHVTSDTVQVKE